MSAEERRQRLLAVLEGIEIRSADGRAGLRTLIAELERLDPGLIERKAARVQLARLPRRSEPSVTMKAPPEADSLPLPFFPILPAPTSAIAIHGA